MDRSTTQFVRKSQAVIEFATVAPLPAPLTGNDGFTAHAATLKTGIATVMQYMLDRSAGAAEVRQHVAERDRLHAALREQIGRIRQMALVVDRVSPGVRYLVRIPMAPRRGETLLTAAKTAVDQLTPIQTEFVSRGMPSDFLTQVTQLVAAAEDTVTLRTAARRRQMAAREGIRQTRYTMHDAIQCMDVIVRALCETDHVNGPTTLASWHRACDPLWASKQTQEITKPTLMSSSMASSGTASVGTPTAAPTDIHSATTPAITETTGTTGTTGGAMAA